MEFEEKKETIWKIKRKEKKGYIELKSIEENGDITKIGIGINKNKENISIEMDLLEFKNFNAIYKSFKELVNSQSKDYIREIIEDEEKINNSSLNSDFGNNSLHKPNIEDVPEIDKVPEVITSPMENNNDIEEKIKNGSVQVQDIDTIDEEFLKKMENVEIPLEQANNDFIEIKNEIPKKEELFTLIEEQNSTNEELFNEMKQKVDDTDDSNFNPDDIFNNIDNIEPTIEKGLTSPEKNDESNIDEMGQNNPEEKKKEKDNKLDPTEWDPW